MINFKLNGKPYQLPDSWASVPAAHLVEVAPARLADPASTALRVRLFCLLTGVPRPLLMRADSADVLDLVQLLDWIWQEQLPGGLISDFEHQGVRYLLPAADFSNVNLGEYIMAEHHLRLFTQRESVPDLFQLVATVCRPERKGLDRDSPEWDGDAREPYAHHLATRRATLLETLPLGLQQLVLAHVVAAQQTLHTIYQKLFTLPEGAGKMDSVELVEGSPLLDLAYGLADKGVFGNFEQTCRQDLYTILEYLDSRRRQEK